MGIEKPIYDHVWCRKQRLSLWKRWSQALGIDFERVSAVRVKLSAIAEKKRLL